jgi:transcriptional regulator with XRE-family HTH domain
MSPVRKRRPRRESKQRYLSLADWRDAHDLNQREAARVLGLTQSKYSRLERRLQFPVRDDLKRIQFVTSVPLDVLVGVAS